MTKLNLNDCKHGCIAITCTECKKPSSIAEIRLAMLNAMALVCNSNPKAYDILKEAFDKSEGL